MTVVDPSAKDWEGWPADQVAQRGTVLWKTLISAGQTDSRALTAGVARVGPGGMLRAHRHAQAEVYIVLEGAGLVTIDGVAADVGPGMTVFIAGDAVHSIENHGESDLRFAYVLHADSFEDVQYVF
jgi:mannose-6-phosphate isomerase-like protein (cupin superfamily)